MTDAETLRSRLELWEIPEPEAARLLSSDEAVADFVIASELVERRLAPERVAAAIRQPAEMLGGRSLRDMALTVRWV